jgi:hypothetical protein
MALSECVVEKTLMGAELLKITNSNIFVQTEKAIFKPISELKIQKNKSYIVQIAAHQGQEHSSNKSFNLKNDPEYDSKYLKYYTYKRIGEYIESIKAKLILADMKVEVIGKSINGLNLYKISPNKLLKKKTLLMFGRHHGDEGTANWIIEGYLDKYLASKEIQDEYQLILYPMVNPDGAVAHSRYNANGRDLNRSWSKSISENYDEINIIHKNLQLDFQKVSESVFLMLDMHGSFREDFIYRVKKNYIDRDFYNKQQSFIDTLAIFDQWQNGNFKHSNGDPGMARIVMVKDFGINALTHESIRDIEINNNENRSIQSLKHQGEAVVETTLSI